MCKLLVLLKLEGIILKGIVIYDFIEVEPQVLKRIYFIQGCTNSEPGSQFAFCASRLADVSTFAVDKEPVLVHIKNSPDPCVAVTEFLQRFLGYRL